MYLMLKARADLPYSVGFVSKLLENPTTENVAKITAPALKEVRSDKVVTRRGGNV